jgi:hypothetical protein
VAWDGLATYLTDARDLPMLVRPGDLRNARHEWADEISAMVVTATVGGSGRFGPLIRARADASLSLWRFIDSAIGERMMRARNDLPLDEARTGVD